MMMDRVDFFQNILILRRRSLDLRLRRELSRTLRTKANPGRLS
jgi:hypothetical protein